jgi:hypothetical protein
MNLFTLDLSSGFSKKNKRYNNPFKKVQPDFLRKSTGISGVMYNSSKKIVSISRIEIKVAGEFSQN